MSSTADLNALRYPIGIYKKPEQASEELIQSWIDTIEVFPKEVQKLAGNLNDETLSKTYRPGGWTVRQLVHHCADSHMNAFIRFKLSMTEDIPTIKPYYEDRWAELPDTTSASVSDSLNLLDGLHSRWTILLRSMSMDDLNRELFHPEHNKRFSLWGMLGMYAWHCSHHLAHIKIALNKN